MNILYVNKVSPRLGGGAEIRIWEVGKRLVEQGHDVSIVCPATKPNLPNREILDGIQIHYLHLVPEMLFSQSKSEFYGPRLSFYIRCGKAVESIVKQGVDIIRDDLSPFPSIPAIQVGHRYSVPLVATVHNLSCTWKRWREFYGHLLGTIGYLGERWFRRRTPYNFVISDSEWLRRSLTHDYPTNRVQWIPNGVDVSLFFPDPTKKINGDEELHLFYPGRFVWLKGHTVLVDAFSQVIESGLKAKLHLAGYGPLLETIQRRVSSLNLDAHVIFHGSIRKEEMPALYRQMDIFVSPSFSEGLSVSMLEAMASGLPIISTEIEAVEGILNDQQSEIVPVNDISALAGAIIKLAERPELRRAMGEWGRKEAETKYTWDMVAKRELAVYQTLAH